MKLSQKNLVFSQTIPMLLTVDYLHNFVFCTFWRVIHLIFFLCRTNKFNLQENNYTYINNVQKAMKNVCKLSFCENFTIN